MKSSLAMRFDALAGFGITECVIEAREIALRFNMPVVFHFNGIDLLVRYDSEIGRVVNHYNSLLELREE